MIKALGKAIEVFSTIVVGASIIFALYFLIKGENVTLSLGFIEIDASHLLPPRKNPLFQQLMARFLRDDIRGDCRPRAIEAEASPNLPATKATYYIHYHSTSGNFLSVLRVETELPESGGTKLQGISELENETHTEANRNLSLFLINLNKDSAELRWWPYPQGTTGQGGVGSFVAVNGVLGVFRGGFIGISCHDPEKSGETPEPVFCGAVLSPKPNIAVKSLREYLKNYPCRSIE